MTEKEILTVIKQFVEGDLDINKFEYICKNSKDFREYVSNYASFPYSQDSILKTIDNTNWEKASKKAEIHLIFRWVLINKNINHKFEDIYLSDAQKEAEIIPDYLCDEAKEWVEENIVNKAPENLNKTEKKKWIKEQIKKTFKYEKKKPIWVQGTEEWPKDKDGEFLIFRKQREKGEEVTYTFYNPKTDEEVEIVEFY